MAYSLSLLDKSAIPEGASAVEAIAATVAAARRAEQLGYHRFWVAEHHGSAMLAGSAPEILVAHILARTTHIRVGTGGVMLQHYAPLKVAEVFRVLEALAPGRVDLGIGKAPGGLPTATKALQGFHDLQRKPDFDTALAELDGFLTDRLPAGHPFADARANPVTPAPPQRILLGGSVESALSAARLGWQFCFAGHFNGDPATVAAALEAYRRETGRGALMALHAVAGRTRDKALTAAGELTLVRLHGPDGLRINLPDVAAAEAYARQAGLTDYRIEALRPTVLAGTAEDVHAELGALADRFGIEEFVLDSPPGLAFADRFASVELLAPVALPRVA